MSKPKLENDAFLDGANLHIGVKGQGWQVDYKRLRVWLEEKLGVKKAYLFIGLVPGNSNLYRSLQEAGFILIFKPTVTDGNGKIKGNCDADMVLNIVSGAYEKRFKKAVIVTSDGDFYGVVEFLKKRGQLLRVISPSPKCSILIKRTGAPISYLKEIKELVQKEPKKKKPPVKTELHKGLSRGDSIKTLSKRTNKIKGVRVNTINKLRT